MRNARPYRQSAGRRRPSRAAAWLGLLALWLGLMAPPGFMPRLGGGDGFSIVVCTGFGLRTIALDDRGAPVDSQDEGDAARAHCPLAGVGAFALPPPAAEPARRFAAVVKTTCSPDLAPRCAPGRLAHGARAPPTDASPA